MKCKLRFTGKINTCYLGGEKSGVINEISIIQVKSSGQCFLRVSIQHCGPGWLKLHLILATEFGNM